MKVDEVFIIDEVSAILEISYLDSESFGRLDYQGHAAMGPVPILGTWRPLGELVDNRGELVRLKAETAFPILVGGGWLSFRDENECCGVSLEPLPWRDLDASKANDYIRDVAIARECDVVLSLSFGAASVWDKPIADNGVSYDFTNKSGNNEAVGALWLDQFKQVWHLQYWLSGMHKQPIRSALQADYP
ncbi:MAG: hypothetical protein SFX73_32375 [Kofleriaceae bacterium]|nr:hypothetical protein [Kofleriaceae bacterium]